MKIELRRLLEAKLPTVDLWLAAKPWDLTGAGKVVKVFLKCPAGESSISFPFAREDRAHRFCDPDKEVITGLYVVTPAPGHTKIKTSPLVMLEECIIWCETLDITITCPDILGTKGSQKINPCVAAMAAVVISAAWRRRTRAADVAPAVRDLIAGEITTERIAAAASSLGLRAAKVDAALAAIHCAIDAKDEWEMLSLVATHPALRGYPTEALLTIKGLPVHTDDPWLEALARWRDL